MAGPATRLSAAALLLAAWGVPCALAEPPPVDLALVLALDASSSVNPDEFYLQTYGLSLAFADPQVQDAIGRGPQGAIAVCVVQWASPDRQVLALGWQRITRDQAPALAETLANLARYVEGGGTAPGAALAFAGAVFERLPYPAARRVIDVSGDGKASAGPDPALLRDRLVARGIAINGLAILNEERDVGRYYAARLIGGAGAFVITANDYDAYIAAIRAKLLREIGAQPLLSQLVRPARP